MKRPLFIAEHARRPHGLLGLIVAEIMSRETFGDNFHAIEMLGVEDGQRIVDIGAGHGRSLREICRASPTGIATGVDDSPKMLAIAARKNAGLIATGRVRLINGSSDALPFDDAAFDAAMTVNTVYFWSEPRDHFREIARVLRHHGRFVIGFHAGGDPALEAQFPAELYRFRTAAEIIDMLEACGFDGVEQQEGRGAGSSMTFLRARKSRC